MNLPRWSFSLRWMLGLIALAALASAWACRDLLIRELDRRGPISEKLLRPIINYHEYGIHSDLTCSQVNWKTAHGHLTGVWGHLASIGRQARRTAAWDPEPWSRWMFRAHARQEFGYCRIELDFARKSLQLAEKQRLMMIYHGHMKAYYQRLRDEYRTELPPLSPEVVAERLALRDEIRRVENNPTFELEPEPLSTLLPGAPAVPYNPGNPDVY